MNIMVTGHSGMLGKEVVKAIKRMDHNLMLGMGPTVDPDTNRIDITKEILVADCCPDIVINCAGLVPQRDPAPTPAEMMRVNGYGPWNLAEWCDQIGARLIQVSTDCVFDGSREGPHSESDVPQPTTSYGKSKLAGEVTNEPHLTVRTSFVGFGERGLIAQLMQCEKDAEPYRASENLLWTGHTTRFVAEALVMLAERDIHGLLHIPGETLTRYELVVKLRSWLNMDSLQYARVVTPEIDRRLGSERWAQERLPGLPSFEWQLEWLSRSQ